MSRKGLTFPESAVSNGLVGTARIREQIGSTAAALASATPAPLAHPILGMVAAKRSKYGNKPCELDGEKFDSEKEMRRWQVLTAEENAGAISGLLRQVSFEIAASVVIDDRKCPARHYVADFVYQRDGVTVIEDVKGFLTQMYRLKRHLMALQGLTITEIK